MTKILPFIYLCGYDFKGDFREARSENGIGEFMYGFWVTKDLEFTKGENCLYWIPPHRICYIKKIDPNEEDHDYQEVK